MHMLKYTDMLLSVCRIGALVIDLDLQEQKFLR